MGVYEDPTEVTPCRKVFFKTPNFGNMGLRENLKKGSGGEKAGQQKWIRVFFLWEP